MDQNPSTDDKSLSSAPPSNFYQPIPYYYTPNLISELLQQCSCVRNCIKSALTYNDSISSLIENLRTTAQDLQQALQQPKQSAPSTYDLLHCLPPVTKDPSFTLTLSESLPCFLHKRKIFTLNIELTVLLGIELTEEDYFSLQIQAFSTESPPRELTKTKKGAPLLQVSKRSCFISFNSRKRLHFGCFRAKFNEVTSHFPGNRVLFRITASPESRRLKELNCTVEPLIIGRVQVRAKKPSTIDQLSD